MARINKDCKDTINLISTKRYANGNTIPVKFEDAELWYDLKDGLYFITLKVGTKKLTLEEKSDVSN